MSKPTCNAGSSNEMFVAALDLPRHSNEEATAGKLGIRRTLLLVNIRLA
jgi:hypothetical protein